MLAANNLEDNTVFYYWLDDGRGITTGAMSSTKRIRITRTTLPDQRTATFSTSRRKSERIKQQIITTPGRSLTIRSFKRKKLETAAKEQVKALFHSLIFLNQ